MENKRPGEEHKSGFQKAEELLFPIAAAVIGIGYAVAIFVNNPPARVFSSPHALILVAIFLGIAFFPVRSFFHRLKGDGKDGKG